jgi:hypothetical protein
MATKDKSDVVKNDEELEASAEEEEVGSEEEVDVTDAEPSLNDLMGQMVDATVADNEDAAKAAFSKAATGVVKNLLNPRPAAVEAEVDDSEGPDDSEDGNSES